MPRNGLFLLATVGLCLLTSPPSPAVSAPASSDTKQAKPEAEPVPEPDLGALSPYSWLADAPEILHGAPVTTTRRLRGDAEPVDLLVLVHDPDWEESLRLIIRHARTRAQVQVLMVDGEDGDSGFREWAQAQSVRITPIPHDSPWIRDYGPFQLYENDHPLWVDYGYNTDRSLDDAVPWELAYDYGVNIDVEFAYLEGGAVVSNGKGLCGISDRSLLETGVPLDEPDVVAEFVTRLGCRALSVLPALPAEQTGHADVSVQFLSSEVVAVASMDAEQFPLESRLLDHAARVLRRTANALGHELRVLRVPMRAQGDIYYSYLNGTRVADLFFVPSYEGVPHAEQQRIYNQLHKALPGVTLVPVPSEQMVELGGAVHCITLGLRVPSAQPPPPAAAPAPAHARRRARKERAPHEAQPPKTAHRVRTGLGG